MMIDSNCAMSLSDWLSMIRCLYEPNKWIGFQEINVMRQRNFVAKSGVDYTTSIVISK